MSELCLYKPLVFSCVLRPLTNTVLSSLPPCLTPRVWPCPYLPSEPRPAAILRTGAVLRGGRARPARAVRRRRHGGARRSRARAQRRARARARARARGDGEHPLPDPVRAVRGGGGLGDGEWGRGRRADGFARLPCSLREQLKQQLMECQTAAQACE